MNVPLWIPELITIACNLLIFYFILKIFIKNRIKTNKIFLILFFVLLILFIIYEFYGYYLYSNTMSFRKIKIEN